MLRIISLGAGVQSTTLLRMAWEGQFDPPPDCAIFADTGWEPPGVYHHLQRLHAEANRLHFPFYIVSDGNIRDDVTLAVAADEPARFASMPLFAKDASGRMSMLRRQCTKEYKLYPIRRKALELLSERGEKRRPNAVELWLGISVDEIARMKPSDKKWIRNRWPLIEREMTRRDCVQWLNYAGFPIPPKSACIGCPFHDNATWARMKRADPLSFADAVDFDHRIRRLPRIRGEVFLHKAGRPLEEVEFDQGTRDQLALDGFTAECEGMCGV